MAFPVVAARATGRTTTTDTTSHAITLPTGITAGDMLLVIASVDGGREITVDTGASGSKWARGGMATNGVVVTGAWFWKVAEGSDALTLTSDVAEQSSHVSLRITGAQRISGFSANGSSIDSAPPAFTPEDGTQDYLWIITRSGDASPVATAIPSGFSNQQSIGAAGSAGASTDTAEQSLNASTLTPGTFTSLTEQWVSWTLAISPLSRAAEKIRYVGGKTAVRETAGTWSTSLTDLVGGLGTAPIEGDYVDVSFAVPGVIDATLAITTSGYTVDADLYANDTYDANLLSAHKIMGSTPDTTVGFSDNVVADNDHAVVTISVWRGVDPTTNFSAAAVTATGINSSIPDPPSITPADTGAVILTIGTNAHVGGLRGFDSPGEASNFLSQGENTSALRDVSIGLGSRYWISGAYDPAPFNYHGTDNTTSSWAAVTKALKPASSATQTLSGAIYSDADSFGAGAILLGAVILTGSLFAPADAFGSGQINRGAVTLAGSLFADADTFGSGQITTGAVTITGALYADTDSFGSGSIVQAGGPQTITGALFSDADSFGAGQISAGVVSLVGSLFADADSFGSGVIVQAGGTQAIIGGLFADPDSFGAGQINTGAVTLAGSLFADPDSFGSGQINRGAVTIVGGLYSNPDSFGAGILTQTGGGPQTLLGVLFADPDSFGSGAIFAGQLFIRAEYPGAATGGTILSPRNGGTFPGGNGGRIIRG